MSAAHADSSLNPLLRLNLDVLNGVDWDDVVTLERAAAPLLERMASDIPLLIGAMHHAMETPELFSRCESDGFFDRVVLFGAPSKGFSVRLHFLVPVAYDRPHNHRATFVTRIIAGGYVHAVFSLPQDIESRGPNPLTPGEVKALQPVMQREEGPGTIYAFHHSAFHSTQGSTDHVSVLVRGPSAKDRLLFLDQHAGSATWMYGGQYESEEQLRTKAMTRETMLRLIRRMETLKGTGTR